MFCVDDLHSMCALCTMYTHTCIKLLLFIFKTKKQDICDAKKSRLRVDKSKRATISRKEKLRACINWKCIRRLNEAREKMYKNVSNIYSNEASSVCSVVH